MNFVEEAVLFPCAGDLLLGIVARPQPGPVEPALSCSGGQALPAGQGNGAVSYTHLDVYKRQGPTVCELLGPIPILNKSNTLTAMAAFHSFLQMQTGAEDSGDLRLGKGRSTNHTHAAVRAEAAGHKGIGVGLSLIHI